MKNPPFLRLIGLLSVLLLMGHPGTVYSQASGVTDSAIRLGSVLPLGGDTLTYGVALQLGLNAALRGETVHGRTVELRFANDFYDPNTTRTEVNRLLDEGVFAFIGNFGTPTAAVALPLLMATNTPAIAFYTGSPLLTETAGPILNFRPRYTDEIAALHRIALEQGITRDQLCVFAQNDSFGMAAVQGLANTLKADTAHAELATHLMTLVALPDHDPSRNYAGPLGVYPRETLNVRAAYESLKLWEQTNNSRCRFIVMAAVPRPAMAFMEYARNHGESWSFGLLSFTADYNIGRPMAERGLHDKLVISHVVPHVSADLPLMARFRERLPEINDPLTIEGFIAGRLFLQVATQATTLTSEDFMAAVRGKTLELEGLSLDFTHGNQGSTQVFFQRIDLDGKFLPLTHADEFAPLFR